MTTIASTADSTIERQRASLVRSRSSSCTRSVRSWSMPVNWFTPVGFRFDRKMERERGAVTATARHFAVRPG